MTLLSCFPGANYSQAASPLRTATVDINSATFPGSLATEELFLLAMFTKPCLFAFGHRHFWISNLKVRARHHTAGQPTVARFWDRQSENSYALKQCITLMYQLQGLPRWSCPIKPKSSVILCTKAKLSLRNVLWLWEWRRPSWGSAHFRYLQEKTLKPTAQALRLVLTRKWCQTCWTTYLKTFTRKSR